MKFVLIGAGSRGMTYAPWAKQHGIDIAAIAEKRPDRLKSAADQLGVPEDMRFADAEPLFALGKIADAAIIATMDRDHYGHVMQALDCGYDILLEKPISPDPRECIAIEERANALGRKITVCHVLRYTNFFMQIKEILDSGELGKVVAIKHSENIGNFHMAHSFVRGNWRNSQLSSPIILQKKLSRPGHSAVAHRRSLHQGGSLRFPFLFQGIQRPRRLLRPVPELRCGGGLPVRRQESLPACTGPVAGGCGVPGADGGGADGGAADRALRPVRLPL